MSENEFENSIETEELDAPAEEPLDVGVEIGDVEASPASENDAAVASDAEDAGEEEPEVEADDANAPDATFAARRGAIEAMLFVSDEPVPSARLAAMLEMPVAEADSILAGLSAEFEEQERGIQLREVAGGWRLYTHPAYHETIEKYVLSWDTQRLSQAALEALAVIAYNQPTTRAVVSSIRGVNSDAVISSLVEKGLVREAGRENTIGQPIIYATTRTFLEKFGLRSIKDLPAIEDFAANEETRRLIVERLSASSVADVIEEGGDDVDDVDDGDVVVDVNDGFFGAE